MQKILLFVLVVALFCGFSSAQPDFSGQYDYKLNISGGLGISQTDFPPVSWYYVLYYSIRGNNITFGVVCGVRNATDWCAIGFSPYGEMVGSDALVGTFNATLGQAEVVDLILADNIEPSSSGNSVTGCAGAVCSDSIFNTGVNPPCTNNAYAISGSYTATPGQSPPGYLYFTFTRPLNATDSICDYAINVAPDPTYIIYSIGSVYPNGTFPVNMQKHYYTLQSVLEPYEVTFQQMPSPSPTPSVNSSPSPSRTPSTSPSTSPSATASPSSTASKTPSPSFGVVSPSSSPDATSDSARVAPWLSDVLEVIF